jgi:hypothetical protein
MPQGRTAAKPRLAARGLRVEGKGLGLRSGRSSPSGAAKRSLASNPNAQTLRGTD